MTEESILFHTSCACRSSLNKLLENISAKMIERSRRYGRYNFLPITVCELWRHRLLQHLLESHISSFSLTTFHKVFEVPCRLPIHKISRSKLNPIKIYSRISQPEISNSMKTVTTNSATFNSHNFSTVYSKVLILESILVSFKSST